MSGWVLTKGLQNLRAQVDAAFPDRDKESDGTIGDRAHMAETSGHNPDDTPGSRPEYDDHDGIAEVRSWDMDADLSMHGVTAQDVVDHIRRLPNVSSVLRYMIYNRRIYRASTGWAAATYTGASPHIEHIHFSGARTQSADNDTRFDYRLEDIAMPTVEEIAQAVWDYQLERPESTTTPKATTSAGGYQRYNDWVTDAGANKVIAAVTALLAALPENVVDALADADRSDADVAAALRVALGDRAAAVGALLAGS